jgi:hypothetical protein
VESIEMRKLRVIFAIVGSVATSCGVTTQPSATEVFNLRQRCADGAKKYTEDQTGVVYSSPHYNVEDNRCYIAERDARFDDSKKAVNPFISIFLIDVQTGKFIVETTNYDDSYKKGEIEGRDVGYEQAEARIEKLMGRKPF